MRTISLENQLEQNEETSSTSSSRCRRIILMGVDIYENDNDSYFWNSVRALNDLGHNIIIIRNRGMSKRDVRQINFAHRKIGTWIPRTICGCFRSIMYMIRSAYTALWVVRNLQTTIAEFEPTIVVSDASCVAVPILHTFGRFQVVCLEYFRELLAEFQPFNQENSMLDCCLEPIRQICLAPAELILVPCQNARELVNRNGADERVHVLYPPAEGENSVELAPIRQLHGHGPQLYPRRYLYPHRHLPEPQGHPVRGHYTFLVVGVYEPRSNFHMLLDAFKVVLESFGPVQQQRVSLVVAGSWSTEGQRGYRRELRAQLSSYSAAVATRITLHSNLGFEERCTLYRTSCAVLNANVYDLYVPSLIEAFYFGRLVITAYSDFVAWIVRDSVTGLMVNELNAGAFARIILTMLQPQGPSYRFIAIAAAHEYDDAYSFESFTDRLQQCILAMLPNAEDNQFADEL